MYDRHPVGFLSKSNVDCPLRDQACLGLLASHHPHHHSHPPRLPWLCHLQISGSLSLSDLKLACFFETRIAMICSWSSPITNASVKSRPSWETEPQSQQCPTIPLNPFGPVLGFIQSRDISRQNCHKNGENDAWHETHERPQWSRRFHEFWDSHVLYLMDFNVYLAVMATMLWSKLLPSARYFSPNLPWLWAFKAELNAFCIFLLSPQKLEWCLHIWIKPPASSWRIPIFAAMWLLFSKR